MRDDENALRRDIPAFQRSSISRRRFSAVRTSSAHAAGQNDERGASRRLCALAALCACGEFRSLLLLCTSGTAMQGRIHLRALNECLKRIVVYFRDPAFACETEQTLPRFQANGLAKLDAADRDRSHSEMTRRRSGSNIIGGLDPFRQWVDGQIAHCTPLALAEISHRLSRYSENIYDTDDGVQLLVAAVGMGLNITAHLAALGVDVQGSYHELEDGFAGVLERSGLAGQHDVAT